MTRRLLVIVISIVIALIAGLIIYLNIPRVSFIDETGRLSDIRISGRSFLSFIIQTKHLPASIFSVIDPLMIYVDNQGEVYQVRFYPRSYEIRVVREPPGIIRYFSDEFGGVYFSYHLVKLGNKLQVQLYFSDQYLNYFKAQEKYSQEISLHTALAIYKSIYPNYYKSNDYIVRLSNHVDKFYRLYVSY